jgi:hypothetical protein
MLETLVPTLLGKQSLLLTVMFVYTMLQHSAVGRGLQCRCVLAKPRAAYKCPAAAAAAHAHTAAAAAAQQHAVSSALQHHSIVCLARSWLQMHEHWSSRAYAPPQPADWPQFRCVQRQAGPLHSTT